MLSIRNLSTDLPTNSLIKSLFGGSRRYFSLFISFCTFYFLTHGSFRYHHFPKSDRLAEIVEELMKPKNVELNDYHFTTPEPITCKWCGAIDIKKFSVTPVAPVSCLTIAVLKSFYFLRHNSTTLHSNFVEHAGHRRASMATTLNLPHGMQ